MNALMRGYERIRIYSDVLKRSKPLVERMVLKRINNKFLQVVHMVAYRGQPLCRAVDDLSATNDRHNRTVRQFETIV